MEDAMTTLEDLIACEKHAVDPSHEQVTRLESRIGAALGIGVGVAATATSLAVTTEASSLLAKLGSVFLTKPAIMWGGGALVGIGLGYSVAVITASTEHRRSPLAGPTQLVEAPAPALATPPPVASDGPPQVEIIAEPTAHLEPPTGVKSSERTAQQSPVDRLKLDAQLLSQVSAALNQGAPAEALRLIEGTSLKGSPLGTEFKAARAIALCQLGRHAQAQSTVQSLKATAPESPALLRVTQACGDK